MMARRKTTADETNFSEGAEAVERWLKGQPPEVSVTIAARSALRTLPRIVKMPNLERSLSKSVLPIFRAMTLSWAAAKYPEQSKAFRALIVNASSDALHTSAAATAVADTPAYAASNAGQTVYAAAGGDSTNAAGPAARATFFTGVPDRAAGTGATTADASAIRGAGNAKARAVRAVDLASAPLWPVGTPEWASSEWTELKGLLLAANDGWDVWTRWYDDRLAGRPSLGEAFDFAIATLPDELWEREPKAVNARIKELIAEHTPPEPIPAQGAGPQFGLNTDLKIALAPPTELDAQGNNLNRIHQQLPLVRQAAGDLAGILNPNSQPVLCRNLADYLTAIAGEPETISWGTVFGLGVRLDNAAAAARRVIADRLRDPLEDAVQEALDSVLMLHGPLILATAEGRELADEADRYRLTRDQQIALREDAQAITQELRNSPDIIERPAAELGEKAAEGIGEGDHPERGTAFGLATVKNVATVLISAGTLAALVPAGLATAGLVGGAAAGGMAWVGYEALKRSQRFTAATSALGAGFDHLHDLGEAQAWQRLIALAPFRRFVRANEQPLRRIAENSTQLRWMTRYIDFIVRTDPREE